MAKTYSINKICDRCGATMQSQQLELGENPDADPAEPGEPVFTVSFGGVSHNYVDVCPKCAKTLERIVSDAGPIQRSHSQGADNGKAKTKGAKDTKDTKDTKGNDGTKMPPPRPPSRPGEPS